jgi:hypothetical protein
MESPLRKINEVLWRSQLLKHRLCSMTPASWKQATCSVVPVSSVKTFYTTVLSEGQQYAKLWVAASDLLSSSNPYRRPYLPQGAS